MKLFRAPPAGRVSSWHTDIVNYTRYRIIGKQSCTAAASSDVAQKDTLHA